jgi:hypothetical protein
MLEGALKDACVMLVCDPHEAEILAKQLVSEQVEKYIEVLQRMMMSH